jgi:ribosomal protein S18 acetylase RimI-like enzyme
LDVVAEHLTLHVVLPGEAAEIAVVRALFVEYQRELDVDLCFQSFQEELDTLPGKYGPPGGVLYIGSVNGDVAACGALRPLDDGVCEIKRVYVRPGFRRRGIGRKITLRLMEDSAQIGYSVCRLDTLRRLAPALAMYEELGFVETQPYNFNPEPDIVYLERPIP